MNTDRRRVVLQLGGLAAASIAVESGTAAAAPQPLSSIGIDVAQFGVRPGNSDDQTGPLQRALDQAASERAPLALGPGVYRASGLNLPAGTQMIGMPGATRIVANRGRSILSSAHAADVQLSGLTFDGGGQSLPKGQGLVTLDDGARVRVSDCEFIGAGGFGLKLEGIAGEVAGCSVVGAADVAIFSLDARGLTIARNQVRRAGNNGIQVWRSEVGEDATIVSDNIIQEIGVRDGGTGQNGNGINVFRAGGVT